MAKSGLRFSIICLFTSLKVSLGDRAEANQCSSVLAWGNPLFSFPSLVFSCAAPSFPRVLTDLIQIANRGEEKSFIFLSWVTFSECEMNTDDGSFLAAVSA